LLAGKIQLDIKIIHLARVLGKRPFVFFSLVTFLIVTILASVNIASRYALKQYVEDQLLRINWDISAYQTGDVHATPDVTQALADNDDVTQHNNLLFLRNSMTTEDIAYVDGQPIRLPWLSLLTTSDTAILPLNIRPLEGKAVLVLVGTKAQMGNAYAELQDKQHFEVKLENSHQTDHGSHDVSIDVFDLELERTIRIERNDLNRWFLEQTSSPALIPEVGAILVIPYDWEIISAFDSLARGIVSQHTHNDIHEEAGNYFPDIIHLLKVDTEKLVSGWDLAGSLNNLGYLQDKLNNGTFAIGPRVYIDNSTKVLLGKMHETAERVGLISLLIALPLIWVGWILMSNLSAMILLNQRRQFGLLRLRGASGSLMGRTLQLSIGSGALLGGVTGGLLGTVLPIWVYEGSMLPLQTVLLIQQPSLLLTFILISMAIALTVTNKLVRYASTISPIEASGRIVRSESEQTNIRFGWIGLIALVLGGYKLLDWIFSYSISDVVQEDWIVTLDQGLDFAGFPLFVYGVVTLLVSRKNLMNRLLQAIISITGGSLCHLTVKHIATRPHRVAGFLLIVAMMTTIGLYPTVMTAVFDNKIDRGTRIQVGSDIQLTINASDIIDNKLLSSGGIGEQFNALQRAVPEIIDLLQRMDGIKKATWTLLEGVTDGVYIPGYGFKGLPLYFIPDNKNYLNHVYYEQSLSQHGNFTQIIERLSDGQVIFSPVVSDFINKQEGELTSIGLHTNRTTMVDARLAGTVWYLPGSPLVSVTDRESFDAARVDYVNFLFTNNAYMVVDPGISSIQNLDVLISSVQIALDLMPAVNADHIINNIQASFPLELSSIRSLEEEAGKIGSDMYIFLARGNIQIFLAGGLLLAILGILSVAYTNYLEDRRTLGLLRTRGAGPLSILRFFGSGIFAPSLIGLVLGLLVALVAGYGITNLVLELRQVKNILLYMVTYIAISDATVIIFIVLLLIIVMIGFFFSQWAFRKTAREGMPDN